MGDKSTEDVLRMLDSYIVAQRGGLSLERLLKDDQISVVKKLQRAQNFLACQQKPPLALLTWVGEALQRELDAQ